MDESEGAIVPKLMVEPTYWLAMGGIRLETVGGLQLFKFTEGLQDRSDNGSPRIAVEAASPRSSSRQLW